jgi:hypothetical protein
MHRIAGPTNANPDLENKEEDVTMRLVKNSTLLVVLTVACSIACLAQSDGSAQSSYTWALSCSEATLGGGVGTGVTWAWLHDGVQISLTSPPNGFASCAAPPLSSSRVIPASINGIQVNGLAVTLSLSEYPAGCQAFASVTKSFDPSNSMISIKASVSAPANVDSFGVKVKCPSASFHFSLSN